METIQGKQLELFLNCTTFAREFMTLPNIVKYYFDDCPSERFRTMGNAMESERDALFVNKAWYNFFIRRNPINVEFFVFHELRHMHQLYALDTYSEGGTVSETKETLDRWAYDFTHYVRNEGDRTTQSQNIKQEIEMDANGYGAALVNMYHLKENEIVLSLPPELYRPVMQRCQYYIDTFPEFQKFLEAQT